MLIPQPGGSWAHQLRERSRTVLINVPPRNGTRPLPVLFSGKPRIRHIHRNPRILTGAHIGNNIHGVAAVTNWSNIGRGFQETGRSILLLSAFNIGRYNPRRPGKISSSSSVIDQESNVHVLRTILLTSNRMLSNFSLDFRLNFHRSFLFITQITRDYISFPFDINFIFPMMIECHEKILRIISRVIKWNC